MLFHLVRDWGPLSRRRKRHPRVGVPPSGFASGGGGNGPPSSSITSFLWAWRNRRRRHPACIAEFRPSEPANSAIQWSFLRRRRWHSAPGRAFLRFAPEGKTHTRELKMFWTAMTIHRDLHRHFAFHRGIGEPLQPSLRVSVRLVLRPMCKTPRGMGRGGLSSGRLLVLDSGRRNIGASASLLLLGAGQRLVGHAEGVEEEGVDVSLLADALGEREVDAVAALAARA